MKITKCGWSTSAPRTLPEGPAAWRPGLSIRELAEELDAEATVVGFLGAVEYSYVDDGAAHHEINLVFEVFIDDPEPASQEDHLQAHWLPLEHLAHADVRPDTLKDALTAAGAQGRHIRDRGLVATVTNRLNSPQLPLGTTVFVGYPRGRPANAYRVCSWSAAQHPGALAIDPVPRMIVWLPA
ncbi:NUDIX domain-containing protein [Gandjariella thermophila]|uniref:Nudix hydrolase domain-containing protein n=1 Tax=Gandjariella thermophila TaxID=1931992 RepID=A0A4D4JF47_9PSEU|nr:NUDIX domain-containing protein [Gandjariella thermophila]GDY33640.1 hypothetical protein GTS_52730 [Gandjariella thermophila]